MAKKKKTGNGLRAYPKRPTPPKKPAANASLKQWEAYNKRLEDQKKKYKEKCDEVDRYNAPKIKERKAEEAEKKAASKKLESLKKRAEDLKGQLAGLGRTK